MSAKHIPEWDHQLLTLLTWPHKHSDWADDLPAIEPVYIEMATTIAQYQTVVILCYDKQHQSYINQTVGTKNISTVIVPTNDTWIRDYGPISILQNRKLKLANFTFNAWGDKYSSNFDNQVNLKLQKLPYFSDCEFINIDLVLEGGSIESDGKNTLLTTKKCLLNPSRNGSLSQAAIEQKLNHALGFKRFLWLEHGFIQGDDTDSHIDMLARFCDEQTIVYTACDDSNDEHFSELNLMAKEIQQFRDSNNKLYNCYPLPLPAAIYDGSRRLPASYANFLIINKAVLLPVYGDERTDKIAINTLKKVFPARQIHPINCRELIKQNGSLHCATMSVFREYPTN